MLERGELIRVGPERAPPARQPRPGATRVAGAGRLGEHEGRDGEAFTSWEDDRGAPPQEVPLPPDLPAGERG